MFYTFFELINKLDETFEHFNYKFIIKADLLEQSTDALNN